MTALGARVTQIRESDLCSASGNQPDRPTGAVPAWGEASVSVYISRCMGSALALVSMSASAWERLCAVSPAVFSAPVWIAAAPDDHFTASPDCRVRSGIGCVGGAGGSPTVGAGIISSASVQTT